MRRMNEYNGAYQKNLKQLLACGRLSGPDAMFPVDFVRAGGLSDANHLAVCGIPIIDGCGPGGGFPHSEKEFLSLETLEKRYLFFTGFLPYLLG